MKKVSKTLLNRTRVALYSIMRKSRSFCRCTFQKIRYIKSKAQMINEINLGEIIPTERMFLRISWCVVDVLIVLCMV